ncbi:MAG: hypothetical protein ABR507_03415 [Actinomycetota bacterium]|nr:hypothetical protein [Actinomycetota bacterium]
MSEMRMGGRGWPLVQTIQSATLTAVALVNHRERRHSNSTGSIIAVTQAITAGASAIEFAKTKRSSLGAAALIDVALLGITLWLTSKDRAPYLWDASRSNVTQLRAAEGGDA